MAFSQIIVNLDYGICAKIFVFEYAPQRALNFTKWADNFPSQNFKHLKKICPSPNVLTKLNGTLRPVSTSYNFKQQHHY